MKKLTFSALVARSRCSLCAVRCVCVYFLRVFYVLQLKSRVTELAKSSSLRVVVGKLLTQAKLTDEDVTRMVSDAGVHSAASADYRVCCFHMNVFIRRVSHLRSLPQKMMISVLHGCLHVAQCPAGCQHPNCNSVRNAYKHVQECEHGNTCPVGASWPEL